MKRLSVIIPVYNEAATINEILAKVNKASLPDGVEKEIIIVDDGSTDGTREVLSKLKSANLSVVLNEKNMGKGGAVRNGIARATGEMVIIQDADLEYDPDDYPAMIAPILSGEADAVMGIRIKDESAKKLNSLYGLGNWLITFTSNLLYSYNAEEYTGGYKAFKTDVVRSINVRSNGFDYEHELISKVLKKGYHLATVPIRYYPRNYGAGKKIKWLDGFKILWVVIKYRFVD
ncbi:MAG: glycosyltransferase family 2 protein [Minisyncoccia bacterium]